MLRITIPLMVAVLLFLLLQLALWGSRGYLPALVAGQLTPAPRQLDRGMSLAGGGA